MNVERFRESAGKAAEKTLKEYPESVVPELMLFLVDYTKRVEKMLQGYSDVTVEFLIDLVGEYAHNLAEEERWNVKNDNPVKP